ncbi:MAG: hypothetical protein EBZ48_03105, partial [Proteobacteria bacterium]|nr:hypothetical protein [Pseudomonadota bacterium]
MSPKAAPKPVILSSVDRSALGRALDKLRQSSRATMFEPLVVGAFAKKGSKISAQLRSASFGELLASVETEWEQRYRLKSSDVKLLVSIIESLVDGDAPMQLAQTAIVDQLAEGGARSPRIESSIRMNSVEAELKLSAILS